MFVRRSIPLVLTLLLAAAVSGCATSAADRAGLRPAVDPAVEIEPAVGPEASLYGLFLAGQAALENGSSRDAAAFLGMASDKAPDAAFLKERAFTAALIAGDVAKAAALAPGPEEGTIATRRLGELTRAVDLMAQRKGREAAEILDGASTQGPTGSAVVLMRPWAAAMAGDWKTALAPAPADNNQLGRLFGALSRARLLEQARRYDEAETAYRGLEQVGGNSLFTLALGEFLERRGRRAEALALYDKTLSAGSDATTEHARARVRAKASPPRLGSLQAGAAEMLLAPAALQMTRRQPEVALALLRLSIRLDPTHDESWLLVGDAMANAGDETAAAQAYNKVRPTAAEYGLAQGRLAWGLQRAGDAEGALRLAREYRDFSRDSEQSLNTYADLLRENGRFEESIEVIDRLIRDDGDGPSAWRLFFTRGVAFERLGHWDKAQDDLQRALAMQPEEPDILNYLGFGWANRGMRLDEALKLLEKAVELRPRSGEIRDSLGWAHFRLGRYEEAVADLERAVSMVPANPEINDHLGDAYWAVGRRLEAEFQWRRVLTLGPDQPLRDAVEAKLRTRTPPGALAAAGAVR